MAEDSPSAKDIEMKATEKNEQENDNDTSVKGSAHGVRRAKRSWPSLYKECRINLASSVLVYTICEFRSAIRTGKIKDPAIIETFMDFPTSTELMFAVFLEHKDLLIKLLSADGSVNEWYIDLILSDRDMLRSGLGDGEYEDSVIILELDDEHGDKEIVYCIEINHKMQRITVVFRGSVTMRDFKADIDPQIGWFPNPVESVPGHPQEESIGVQLGFAGYMNGTTKKLGEGKTKQIRERILELLKEYPTYYVYCTGHSLGGALATLMAFDLATTPEMSNPVSCISVACPKVGNIDFRHAFQALEKMGRVRCVRVANDMDVVTTLPTRACCCLDCCCASCLCCTAILQSRRFWHVGAKVKLYSNGSCEVHYQREQLTYRNQVRSEISKQANIRRGLAALWRLGSQQCRAQTDFLKNHSCKEYVLRLDAVTDELSSRYLQDLYFKQSQRSITKLKKPSDVGEIIG